MPVVLPRKPVVPRKNPGQVRSARASIRGPPSPAILVGNYVRGTIFLSEDEVHLYDATQWVTPAYPPAVPLGSEYASDMRHMDAALTEAGAAHELVDPLAERGLEMPHCFVASERVDEVSRDAFERTLAFLEEQGV